MSTLAQLLQVLPWPDWVALAALLGGWAGYAKFARLRSLHQPSLLAATNRERRLWMLQASLRENRVMDGIVVQNLSTPPSFFASTTILIIGALLAALFAGDKAASEFVREVPFAARTSVLVFDLKVAVMAAIFIYAFFRFSWSVRQYSFGMILVAAAPEYRHFANDEAAREAFANRAGRLVGLAAESFNDGIRAYYFAFAAAGWFISPWACIVATASVVLVLYWREFQSEVLHVLAESG